MSEDAATKTTPAKKPRSAASRVIDLAFYAAMVLMIGMAFGYFGFVKDGVRAVVNTGLEGEVAPTIEASTHEFLLPAGVTAAPEVDKGWRILAFFKST